MKRAAFIYFAIWFVAGISAAEESQIPSSLVESWLHDESGARLNIEADGAFQVLAPDGSSLSMGTVRCTGWDEADWVPGNYARGLILRFEQDGKTWVVTGYSILGEGGPMGLTLFSSLIYADWLFEPFGVTNSSSKLVLRGPQP